ncbi:MAG TPA: response regulator, partial [Alphaproteobacteria bacterium]
MALTINDLTVLVVDDNREGASFAGSAVRAAGLTKVIVANSPEMGMQLFDAKSPDIVMASWEMKPMNGIEFTRRLRSASSPNMAVPVILMVSLVSMQMVAEARDAGVTEFLCRPFSVNHVTVRLTSVVNNPRKFIASPNYRGPDRRRTKSSNY